MIAKFFPKGKAGLAYLKSKDFCPTLIGNERETQELIDGSRFKNPSTAGVLTFEEHIEDDEKKREICERFTAEVLAPGIDRSAISITWVEHQEQVGGDDEDEEDEKKPKEVRTGLHFVMSNEHLETGQRIQPFWYKRDMRYVKSWQTLINHDYGFSDPDEPEKRQTLSFSHNLPKGVAKAREAITEAIEEQISIGNVQNYAEVKEYLTETLGLEITREGKRKGVNGVSVRVEGHARPLRLSGGIYESAFTADNRKGPSRESISEERIGVLRGEFDAELSERIRNNNARFPSPEPEGLDRADDPDIDQPRADSPPLPSPPALDDDGKSRYGITERFGGLIKRARGAAERIGKIAEGLAASGLRAIQPRRGFDAILRGFNEAIRRDMGPPLGDWRGPQPFVSAPEEDGRIESPGLEGHRPPRPEAGGLDF